MRKKRVVTDEYVFDVYVQEGSSDELMLEEIFNDDYYKMREHLKEGDRVLDLGGQIGMFTTWVKVLGAGDVVAYEPYEPHLEYFKRNTEKFHNGVKLVNKAVYTSNGEVILGRLGEKWEGKKHTGAIDIFGTDGNVRAECVSIVDVLKEWGKFDIIKLDIEGAELEVLRLMTNVCTQEELPRVFTMEFHGNTPTLAYQNGKEIEQMLNNKKYKVKFGYAQGTTQGRIVACKPPTLP